MMTATLTVTDMSKNFGGQLALDRVSLSIEPGEIRALVGQNGCGKSTLIKILAGFHEPDDGGSVEVDGEPLAFANGAASEAAGLRFVHQDLGLVGSLDTVDNLAMGLGYPSYRGRIRWSAERKTAREALESLGYHVDVRRPVASLAVSERTAVAVARALANRGSEPKLLVLDEPTANLPAAEAERLYQLIRRVSSTGLAVMFVSHHVDEVFELAQTVTVLRDGRHVVTRPVDGLTEPGLIELVIGRTLDDFTHDSGVAERDKVVLGVTGLTGAGVRSVDLQVHAGEIVGVAGITGSGRDELASLLFGGHTRTGEVLVDGVTLPGSRPDLSMEVGMGLVPADRHANAAFMTATLRENVTLVDPRRHMRGGFLRQRSERSDVAVWLEKFDVRPNNTEFRMSELSGGNQQKVVLARWLRNEPKILVLDEPTQGVDVGAKADIHAMLDAAAAQGTAVLIVSTDHEELVRLCHRVLVLRKGRVVAQLSGPALHTDAVTAATIGRDLTDAA
jgi:ribose transport system ATP-binding protein